MSRSLWTGIGAVVMAGAVLGLIVLGGSRRGPQAEIEWQRSLPQALELSGRPQLVEFFHPT